MTEPEKTPTIEEKIAVVDEWLYAFNAVARREAEITEIDTGLVRDVLAHFGAEFDPDKEGYNKLKQSTNKWRRPGMDAVWGHEYMNNYNRWTTEWAKRYETRAKRGLPELKQSEKPEESSLSKTSGMRHWLGELTAYAAGALTFEQYQERQSIRLRNGYARATAGELEEATFLADEKRFPSSTPPRFVDAAWEKVKSKILKNPD